MKLRSRHLFLTAAALSIASCLVFAGCGGTEASSAASTEGGSPEVTDAAASAGGSAKNAATPASTINYASQTSIYGSGETTPITNPVVVLHTSAGDIQIELLMEQAPKTVGNFLDTYARQGAYENTIFHYVDPKGFVLGGGYTEELVKKPTRGAINNESNNGLSHERGTVAMSRDEKDPNSATCEFFINVVDNTGLNYQGPAADQRGYCVFGRVTQGMEVVDKIAAAAVTPKEGFDFLPTEAIVIQSVEEVK